MNPRVATMSDVPALHALIEASMRGLSMGYYTAEQVEGALTHALGVDTQLISDGTYYIIDGPDGPAAAGGWSGRRTLYGGDQMKGAEDPRLDPAAEPARIRAFYVHPRWARRGLARRIFGECSRAAWAAGFRRFELVATRPGEPLYSALGMVVSERIAAQLPGGLQLPAACMGGPIDPAASHDGFALVAGDG